jgi:hypothetical protein
LAASYTVFVLHLIQIRSQIGTKQISAERFLVRGYRLGDSSVVGHKHHIDRALVTSGLPDIGGSGRHVSKVPQERKWWFRKRLEGSQAVPGANFAYVTLSSHDRRRRSEPPVSAAIHAGDTAGDLYACRFRTSENHFSTVSVRLAIRAIE